jgi:inner membrane protein
MDPICHSLVGASLGATGLARKTRYAVPTLVLAANLPDIDGIAYFFGTAAYVLRRGTTHGIPAMLILPVLLALAMRSWSRFRGADQPGRSTSLRWLLILSALGVASHPALDWLNTYGMRWLMPFADTWFYGDTLFIADGIVWALLLAGLLATRWMRAERLPWHRRPACWTLAALLVYVGMNFAITRHAGVVVERQLAADPPLRFMASPVPYDPFMRMLVLEYPGEYRFGKLRLGSELTLDPDVIAKGDPAVFAAARRQREGRWFLFPYAFVDDEQGRRIIRLADARYVRDLSSDSWREFGRLSLEVRD